MIKNALTTVATFALTALVSGTLVISAVGPASAHGAAEVASAARMMA